MTFNEFCVRRVIRLYPLACLSVIFGLALMVMKALLFPDLTQPLSEILRAGMLNLMMIPDFVSSATLDGALFPTNGPLWSLFFELLINFLWAAFAVAARMRWLLSVLVVSGLAVIWTSAMSDSANGGAFRDSFFAGLARVTFGFTMGLTIYRLRDRLSFPAVHWSLIAVVLVLIVVPVLAEDILIWDLFAILVALPLVVAVASTQGADGRVARLLGDLSYPIYVLHWPFFVLASGLYQTLGRQFHPYIIGTITLIALILVSYVALRWFDEPVRKWLTAYSKGRPPERQRPAHQVFANSAGELG